MNNNITVYKFGGASVKNAQAVKNIKCIIEQAPRPLLIVVSAMDKTTNALETVTELYFNKNDYQSALQKVKDFHLQIIKELFENKHPIYDKIHNIFVELEWELEEQPSKSFDFHYDQIVSFGELLSTTIVTEYLKSANLPAVMLDARDVVKTDFSYRHAKINWQLTQEYAQKYTIENIVVTQGFIGVNDENYTTTLGREGSDFSAAIFAYIYNASNVIIWKDVPGMLNADPKHFPDAVPLNNISYKEAVELAYYGASVIHPKTIKPLKNKNIPLSIKSFVNTSAKGTLINNDSANDAEIPSYIIKKNQWLLSISAKDFSFILEENIAHIFQLISEMQVKVNLMENTALSFSICVDDDFYKVPELINKLSKNYNLLYNKNVELATVRHYTDEALNKVIAGKEILLEQKSRNTARYVLK
jgi:aspartate kinase